MKICLIAPIPPYRGGIAKYCYSLAQELEKRHELLLLSYKRQYPELLYGRKPQLDATCDRATVAGGFQHVSYDIDSVGITSWLETVSRIEAFAPDVVVLPWWVTFWTPFYVWLIRRLRKRKIRCLLLCINVYEHEGSLFKRMLSNFVLRRADLMIAHSGLEKNELQNINRKADIRTHLLPLFRYNLTSPLGTGRTFKLLFFGFVRPYKGLDILLKAVARLPDLDIVLRITGEFWFGSEQYLALIEELGIADRVEIIDRYVTDEEMASCFLAADLVVLPYRTSKTSGVISTAYGFGRPVLATDVGGFHEVVDDGSTGRLVPPEDPLALADGIRWFYDNRNVDFAGNIASFVEQRMSWSSFVDTIEEMVERVS